MVNAIDGWASLAGYLVDDEGRMVVGGKQTAWRCALLSAGCVS